MTILSRSYRNSHCVSSQAQGRNRAEDSAERGNMYRKLMRQAMVAILVMSVWDLGVALAQDKAPDPPFDPTQVQITNDLPCFAVSQANEPYQTGADSLSLAPSQHTVRALRVGSEEM